MAADCADRFQMPQKTGQVLEVVPVPEQLLHRLIYGDALFDLDACAVFDARAKSFALRGADDQGLVEIAMAGGTLIYRGETGNSNLYKALSVSTAKRKGLRASVKHGAGIKVEKSVTINKPVEELFRFWHNFENLPSFLRHLESVRAVGGRSGRLSHWAARLPAGMKVEWDAEIINEAPNELIAWRSLEGAQIPNAGSVRFERIPNGEGAEVKVTLEYSPPAGKIGSLAAKFFGEDPERRVAEDLRRFKHLMETAIS